MSKYIVTITPPTPNGDLHIGHIAGPFLSADVFTRIQRQRGHECVLLSYSDDYQSYMQRKGIETGIEPTVLAQSNTEKIKRSLAAMKISVDNWMSPYNNPFLRMRYRNCSIPRMNGGRLRFTTLRNHIAPVVMSGVTRRLAGGCATIAALIPTPASVKAAPMLQMPTKCRSFTANFVVKPPSSPA